VEDLVSDIRMSTTIPWCYYCNEKGHDGRQCQKQLKIITPGTLTQELVQKWDKSVEGAQKIGDLAPNCKVWSLLDKREIDLFEESWNEPIILNFGSYS